ncbi:outer membrane protein [Bosea sp. 117]|uniref:outer membrane protein n=1 Tax=Bosea sp. 117 TaxID=1125973 RepID=UPI0004949FF4|nr:outer membrane protein [Bosea sp. 117]
MVRKLLSGTALAVALSAAPAMAADLSYPVKAPIVAVVPVFTWTGFYIGGSVGYGWTSVDGVGPYYVPGYDSYINTYTSGSMEPDGWFGGLQAGYNYQFYNNVVLGIEADVMFADMKDTFSFGYGAVLPGITDTYNATATAKIDTFGTVRARLGYAADRFLPYITGGLAWANVEVSGNGTVDLSGGPQLGWYQGSESETYWGWAIGAGVEYAVTDHWTLKAEYIYSDLGATNFDQLFNSSDLDFSIQTLKVGVNYKF